MQKAFTIALAVIAILSMGMAWHCSNRCSEISTDASRQISRLAAENRALKRALETSTTQKQACRKNTQTAGGRTGGLYAGR